jgi:hypothetical protein
MQSNTSFCQEVRKSFYLQKTIFSFFGVNNLVVKIMVVTIYSKIVVLIISVQNFLLTLMLLLITLIQISHNLFLFENNINILLHSLPSPRRSFNTRDYHRFDYSPLLIMSCSSELYLFFFPFLWLLFRLLSYGNKTSDKFKTVFILNLFVLFFFEAPSTFSPLLKETKNSFFPRCCMLGLESWIY